MLVVSSTSEARNSAHKAHIHTNIRQQGPSKVLSQNRTNPKTHQVKGPGFTL